MARAKAIVAHAGPLPRANDTEQLLRSDLLRAGWIFAVAALDGYFCDAYTDLIAGTISSKSRQPEIILPECFYEIKVSHPRGPRRIREPQLAMADGRPQDDGAPKRHQSLDDSTLFNKFFREDQEFFDGLLDAWMSRSNAKIRMFGVLGLEYTAMTPPNKGKAQAGARAVRGAVRDHLQALSRLYSQLRPTADCAPAAGRGRYRAACHPGRRIPGLALRRTHQYGVSQVPRWPGMHPVDRPVWRAISERNPGAALSRSMVSRPRTSTGR